MVPESATLKRLHAPRVPKKSLAKLNTREGKVKLVKEISYRVRLARLCNHRSDQTLCVTAGHKQFNKIKQQQ